MKRVFSLLVIGFFAAGGFAAPAAPEALTVAVTDFAAEAGAANHGGNVTALVTASLATDTNLIMLERGALNKALGEQAFGASGLVNAETAARIGQVTGAKVLVCGQVMTLEQHHLVIVADIIGTETARLFAARVEGPEKNLEELTSELSSKIAQTIAAQAANLVSISRESASARLERIVKAVHGTNRPTVSVYFYHPASRKDPSFTANTEMGLILQKTGFVVVDGNSERKPDVEITGLVGNDDSRFRDGMHIASSVINVKVQDRRTGSIIALDSQEQRAVDATQVGAQRSAQALAVDQLAERILPLLAK